MIPRYYQSESVESAWSHLCSQSGSPVIVLPTGAGKSLCIAMLCRDAVERFSGRVIVLAHRRELLEQNAEKIRVLMPELDIGIYSAGLNSRDTDHDIVLGGIQSVYNKAHDFGSRQLVLIDECVTGDTLIVTPRGEHPISSMRVGDAVCNVSGVGFIQAIRESSSIEIYRVEFSNGRIVKCTGNHRFFSVGRGWVRADCLEAGESVVDYKTVSSMRLDVSSKSLWNEATIKESMGCSEVLLHSLCKTSLQSGRNARGKRQAQAECFAEWNDFQGSRWERKAAFNFSDITSQYSGGWMGTRNSSSHKNCQGKRISNLLQDRHRKQILNDRNRSRRDITYHARTQIAGSQKGLTVTAVGLDNLSNFEQRRAVPVYDLQVSGHPSFFANGILVHNCHLIPSDGEGMYKTFLSKMREINPNIRMVGLTATPFRTGDGKLCRPDALFQRICYSAPIGKLINEGYLCNLTTKAADASVDTSGLHIRAGEFVSGEMAALFSDDAKIRTACIEVIAKTLGRKSTLIFCAGVQHAQSVAEKIAELTGEECGLVTGETLPIERASLLSRFKSGSLKRLCNCDVLTTGFDAPGIDAIAVLRATASPGLFAQICGRGLRTSPNKTDCLILDFGSNVKRHGPIDAPDYGSQSKGKGGNGDAPTKTCPNCEEPCALSARECGCGFVFPPRELARHEGTAGEDAILAADIKPTRWIVEEVRMSRHKKKGGTPDDPDTLRVDYVCQPATEAAGNLTEKRISEWVCLEHDGFARTKARKWWQERSNAEIDGIDDAVSLFNRGAVATPTSISTKPDGKFLRIVEYELDDKPTEWREDESVEVGDWDDVEIPF